MKPQPLSPLWPIHPVPLPDELLSSWMLRLAWANGFKVHTFYAEQLGRHRQIWTRDIDHQAPDWLLEHLVNKSGVHRAQVEQTTLRSFESIVFEKLNPNGCTRFLLPISIYHRSRRRAGQQYCPQCLAEDQVPYLRRHWRLSLSMVCVKHRLILEEQCPECHQPIAPHRADMRSRGMSPVSLSLRRCGHCDAFLTSKMRVATAKQCAMQTFINTVLDQGWIEWQGSCLYSHLFFDGLHVLMRGLARRKIFTGNRQTFDLCGVDERLLRMAHVFDLLDSWPRPLIDLNSTMKAAYSAFTADGGDIPFWLWFVLRQELYLAKAKISEEEIRALEKLLAASGSKHMGLKSFARKDFGINISNHFNG